ncbi:MAG: hypothetical protein NZ529_06915 [Cytophagaceae bacterium]|nr:hypothetical protein [Cytophagaceae bacterium]MDW8456512.1 hypothetical protein [Cytophagaceae bacterium]
MDEKIRFQGRRNPVRKFFSTRNSKTLYSPLMLATGREPQVPPPRIERKARSTG